MNYHGRARVNPRHPEAFAICDRCGGLWNLVDLRPQMQWSGASLTNTGWLVCSSCLDVPNPQLRSRSIRPDPVPVKNPRPGYAWSGVPDAITTEIGVPVDTEDGSEIIKEGP